MNSLNILLVEDSPEDAELVTEAFKVNGHSANFQYVRDGEEAMALLRREGPYAEAPRPDLVLLDLNMPRKDGREVLAEIKADADLRALPVVILTTSSAEVDVVRSYADQASSFLTKPLEFDEFLEQIRKVGEHWLTAVRLPANVG
ncbi:MAG: response regulator [Pseudomonadota bacterium]